MSTCKVCHLDSTNHSKKLWVLHQQAQICAFCQKNSSEHNEKLWEMHNLAVEKDNSVNSTRKLKSCIQLQLDQQEQELQEYAD